MLQTLIKIRANWHDKAFKYHWYNESFSKTGLKTITPLPFDQRKPLNLSTWIQSKIPVLEALNWLISLLNKDHGFDYHLDFYREQIISNGLIHYDDVDAIDEKAWELFCEDYLIAE